MGKPGAKKNDLIVSATPGDVHIIMIPSPGGPVPTPIPHPCASMIKDGLAPKVKVMGQPGAVKGSTSKHSPPHIPMGPGPFQKPPANKGEIVTASSNVKYESKDAAMMGDTGKMCADPADAPVGKVIGTAMTVLVGGGGGGSDAARAAASAAAMLAASAACHAWINANMPPGANREQAHRDVCTATGHPVDVATGKLFTKVVDVVCKGRIPLEVSRNYSSARPDRGPLGVGWRHSWEIELIVASDFVAMRDEHGRYISFMPVMPGEASPATMRRFTLIRDHDGRYSVLGRKGLRYRFGAERPGVDGATIHQVVAVEDGHGNRAQLDYDATGRLSSLTDTAGRIVYFLYTADGLLAELRWQEEQRLPPRTVRRFAYKDGVLVAVQDEVGNRWRYKYAPTPAITGARLLVQETDRNGESFYFVYDPEGWCVETWGDGGLLYRKLRYDRARRCTEVVDGGGYRVIYKWIDEGVVTERIDHAGHTLRFVYNEMLECVAQENALGLRWTYEYDDAGRMTSVSTPDGATLAFSWDARGRLVNKVDAYGGMWEWAYDDELLTSTMRDPLGNETRETRDARGDLIRVTAADGREVRLTYDDAGNCIEMLNGDGLRIRRTYDVRGDLLREVDQYGIRLETEYDARGFQTRVRHRGQGESRFERDAEGRVIRLTTATGGQFEYEYLPFLRKMTRVRQTSGLTLGNGERIVPEGTFTYDSEARLVRALSNGHLAAELEYAQHPSPNRIRYSDGREHVFERDPQGVITRLLENGELVFTQEANAVGRVVRRVTGDGEEFRFEYDAAGHFVAGEAGGDTLPVEFERDALGRITAQAGGAGTFSFTYDPIGYCTGYARVSDAVAEEDAVPLNVGFEFTRPGDDAPGRSLDVGINGRRALTLAYDGRQRVTAAAYAGNDRHEFVYGDDALAERVIHRNNDEHTRERFGHDDAGQPNRYRRDDGSSLVYRRDERNRLIAVIDEDSRRSRAQVQEWAYDSAGDRIEARAAQSDGPDGDGGRTRCTFEAHRPVRCGDEIYTYDHRGRVVARTDAAKRTTKFHWNSLSQLRRVELPDGASIEYDYDVLGRRVAKRRQTPDGEGSPVDRFEWIDNFLVHEETGSGDHRHYLYHASSFTPMACVTRHADDDEWSVNAITTDYRGAPIAVTAPGGRDIWRAEVLPWGERRIHLAEGDMPLGMQGQYDDVETGLFYNNARYYNPMTGTYLSPDPIGLAGGENPFQYVPDPIGLADPLGLNPEHIALGLTTYKVPRPDGSQETKTGVLSRFADDPVGDGSVKAETWGGFDPVVDEQGLERTGPKIHNAMQDAKTIHFNLEGMGTGTDRRGNPRKTVQDILNNPDPELYDPPTTEWELATILSDPKLREKTIFYDAPGVKSKQIPCAT
jgi:RHS repeat-associated protein